MTPPPDRKRGSNVSHLRDDIDSGRAGDKVRGNDPAAAPLGTDDEAAGTPPDSDIVDRERRAAGSAAPRASRETGGAGVGRIAIYAIVAVALAVVVILLAAFVPH